MGQTVQYSCDYGKCGKDISRGRGRTWRLVLRAESCGINPDTKSEFNAGNPLSPDKHFCNENCLAGWALDENEANRIAQAEFDKPKSPTIIGYTPPHPK